MLSHFREKTVPTSLVTGTVSATPSTTGATAAPPIPGYLSSNYWWAYMHPWAVRLFEREWAVNLILWGNYGRLSQAVLDGYGESLAGRSLQLGCVYGGLTAGLAGRLAPGAQLDVVDLLPIQLDNLGTKLGHNAQVALHQMDSSALAFADASFDRVLLFFLLHEQPHEVRLKTLAEALRVLRPAGSLTIVDFAPPARYHPQRWLWNPLLAVLEPFASELWRDDVLSWLPPAQIDRVQRRSFFGGAYQMLTVTLA